MLVRQYAKSCIATSCAVWTYSENRGIQSPKLLAWHLKWAFYAHFLKWKKWLKVSSRQTLVLTLNILVQLCNYEQPVTVNNKFYFQTKVEQLTLKTNQDFLFFFPQLHTTIGYITLSTNLWLLSGTAKENVQKRLPLGVAFADILVIYLLVTLFNNSFFFPTCIIRALLCKMMSTHIFYYKLWRLNTLEDSAYKQLNY